MYTINMQALSQNQAWAGRRYKTNAYKEYTEAIKMYLSTFQLPKIKPKEKYYLYFVFGIPSRQDCSNCVKLFEDILSDYLGVNDRDVYALYSRKVATAKQDCYIRFGVFTSEHELIQAINTEL